MKIRSLILCIVGSFFTAQSAQVQPLKKIQQHAENILALNEKIQALEKGQQAGISQQEVAKVLNPDRLDEGLTNRKWVQNFDETESQGVPGYRLKDTWKDLSDLKKTHFKTLFFGSEKSEQAAEKWYSTLYTFAQTCFDPSPTIASVLYPMYPNTDENLGSRETHSDFINNFNDRANVVQSKYKKIQKERAQQTCISLLLTGLGIGCGVLGYQAHKIKWLLHITHSRLRAVELCSLIAAFMCALYGKIPGFSSWSGGLPRLYRYWLGSYSNSNCTDILQDVKNFKIGAGLLPSKEDKSDDKGKDKVD